MAKFGQIHGINLAVHGRLLNQSLKTTVKLLKITLISVLLNL
jgi:hypothetical protein